MGWVGCRQCINRDSSANTNVANFYPIQNQYDATEGPGRYHVYKLQIFYIYDTEADAVTSTSVAVDVTSQELSLPEKDQAESRKEEETQTSRAGKRREYSI